jgi:ketosteroid isomerase-like protein
MNPTTLIERYLTLIADPRADLASIGELLDHDMRFVERPNLVSPHGSERDAAEVLASVARGRQVIENQDFEVVDHLVAGDTVATRVVWTGTPAVDGPAFRAGSLLRADSSMYFRLRDGRIAHQENYDCFHRVAAASG